MFFCTAIPAVDLRSAEKLNPLNKESQQVWEGDSPFNRVFFLVPGTFEQGVFFPIPSPLYPLSKGWLHFFGSQFFSCAFLPFEQGVILYLPLFPG